MAQQDSRSMPNADSDSISSQEPRAPDGKKPKSRRPANTAFRQQRLKAWQPIMTPKTVLPLFFIVGIIFAPIGGLLLWASAEVEEISIDYSNCNTTSDTFTDIPGDKISHYFKSSNYTGSQPPQWKTERREVERTVPVRAPGVKYNTSVCTIQFEILNDLKPPVLFYYRLSDFYQNHRRYVKSLDMDQLMGKVRSNGSIDSGDCSPLKLNHEGKAYYPCGLIANSIFNDTFSQPKRTGAGNEQYNFTDKGIAWSSDRDLYKKSGYTNDQVVPPRNWELWYPNQYNDAEGEGIPDLSEWEGFHVWMRTAGLPTFSKLALRNDNELMAAGRYEIEIEDNFPVNVYGGSKAILISTRTVMGGKNPFLGIAYIVVGGLCILLGALFLVAWVVKPRKLGDHTYLTWDQDKTATATTTGRSGRGGNDAA